MSKISMILFLMIASLNAEAAQIFPENDPNPKCYTGNIDTAWDELMAGDYDPVFDDGKSYMEDGTIVAIQVDENGDLQESRLTLCKPAILGEYSLAKPDKKSDLQRAELVYNADNKLVVRTDRNDAEYELTEPDKNNVVFQYEDEANCDGDESWCSYDYLTEIKLLSTKNAQGKDIPQLSIEITVSYAWDESCGGTDENGDDQPVCEDETTTYVLNWKNDLPYSIPFYTNMEHSADLLKAETQCKEQLKDIEFDDETGYLGAYDICGGFLRSFKYRDDFKTAFSYFLQDHLGGNEKKPVKVDAQFVKDYFSKARNLSKKYTGKGTSKITASMITEQIDAMEKELMKYDTFFNIPALDTYDNDAKFIAINSKEKIITVFEVKFKR